MERGIPGNGNQLAENELLREQNKLESLESVQKRISDVNGEKHKEKEGLSLEELARETSKEKILTDLIIARRKLKEGTKEWGDYTKMIAEYSKIKQDDIQVEDTTVHIYLPKNTQESNSSFQAIRFHIDGMAFFSPIPEQHKHNDTTYIHFNALIFTPL